MQETASDIKNVLAYLRGMVERCREANRRDLVFEYEDAVDLVAARMYGELPPRRETYFDLPLPALQLNEAESKPVRRIIGLTTVKEGRRTFTCEQLECGHLGNQVSGNVHQGKRRQCSTCPPVPSAKKAIQHTLAWSGAVVIEETASSADPQSVDWSGTKSSLRKITGRYYKRSKGRPVPYERLECGHEQLGPIGHSILHQSRRCFQCQKQRAAVAKKKPSSVPAREGQKAVTA